MKTSKFLFGTLVVALFMVVPAIAGVPGSFTGDVEADFDPALYEVLVIPDPSVLGPNEITVVYPPLPDPNATVYTSGWNIKDLRLAYDPVADTLYVGVNSYGIIGDVDGNGDPNTSFDPNQWNDYPFLSNGESVAVYFDLDFTLPFLNTTAWDVIAGVSAPGACENFAVAPMNLLGGFNPGSNFGTPPLTYHYDPLDPPTCPSPAWPDYEFKILHFSELAASVGIPDPQLDEFRVGVYAGSQNDGNVGEDFIYYHQRPSTMVTIVASALQPGDPQTVDLTVTEENDSPSAFLGQQTGPSNPVGLPFHDVMVDVTANGSPPFVTLGYPSRPPIPGTDVGGDEILGILEEWTWNSTNVTELDDVPVPVVTTFEAFASGVDPAGFIHDFLEDPQEANFVDVNLPPCINVTKVVDCNFSKVDDTVIYTICIENCGPTIVFPTMIFDDVLGDLLPTFEAPPPVGCFEETPLFLYPGETCCLDFPYTIQPEDDPGEIPDNFGNTLVNTVTFEAIDEFDQAVGPVDANATVTLVHPCLDVVVECLSDPNIGPGDNAEFGITLNNCGDVDLSVDVSTNWGICEANDLFIPAEGGSANCQDVVPIPPEWADPNICLEVTAHWDIFDDLDGCLDNEGTIDANISCPVTPPGGEGCTPGFWKNNARNWGASAWCDAYSPGDDFSDTFGITEQVLRANGKNTYPNPTLLQALDANGGGINALARHAVAALLNACSDCVKYPMSTAQIIAAVQAAVAAGDAAIQALHEELAYYNEAGCPVNQHGECVGVDEVDGTME